MRGRRMLMKRELNLKKQAESLWPPSIRSYLILMNLVLLCLLFPAVSSLFLYEGEKYQDEQVKKVIRQMRTDLENRSRSLARSMALSAGHAVAGYDYTFLNIMVNQLVAGDDEISYGIIMDTRNKAVAHSNPEMLGSVLARVSDRKARAVMEAGFPKVVSDEYHMTVRFMDGVDDTWALGGPVMEAIAPIYSGARLWGILRCGYSLARLHDEIRTVEANWAARIRQFKIYLATITGFFFSLGVMIAGLFTRTFVRSTLLLSKGVNLVSEGNLDHEILQKGMVCVEFVRLSEAFNAMTKKLRRSHQQLDEYNKSLELKVAERTRELKDAQANLLQQAHEAGMAEMAVGILHNIGNAITPAKVSISLLQNRLAQSPLLRYLPAAMVQFEELVAGATGLSDKKRDRLRSITRLLPETIREEYGSYSDEIRDLRKKHDHIEGIISLQMRYARLFGDAEEVDVAQVADDALQLLDESIHRRSVHVEKHYSKVPRVRIEEAKLIQIIVNLIKNGYESMDNLEIPERRLTIATWLEKGPRDHVVLSVKDRGVGFSPEEKEKLFKFGHTTKARGSGFGLHSCANYLIANKASISASSDGKGKGAEFVVRLLTEEKDNPGIKVSGAATP